MPFDIHNFRLFDSGVERQAAEWRGAAVDTSDRWHPWNPPGIRLPRDGLNIDNCTWVTDGRNIAFVKRKARQQDQFETPEGAKLLAQEKIISDIAFDLGIPVAPGTLWQPPYHAADQTPWYLSLAPFPKSGGHGPSNYKGTFNLGGRFGDSNPQNAQALAQRYPDPKLDDLRLRNLQQGAIERRLLTEAAPTNTALWVFNLWVGDHPEHQSATNNLISMDRYREQGPRLAGIDYAYAKMQFVAPLDARKQALTFSGRQTGNQWNPAYDPSSLFIQHYETWQAPVDAEASKAMLARIAAYPNERIAEIVQRIPSTMMDDERKAQIVQGLIESKTKTQNWIEQRLTKKDVPFTPAAVDAPHQAPETPQKNTTDNPAITAKKTQQDIWSKEQAERQQASSFDSSALLPQAQQQQQFQAKPGVIPPPPAASVVASAENNTGRPDGAIDNAAAATTTPQQTAEKAPVQPVEGAKGYDPVEAAHGKSSPLVAGAKAQIGVAVVGAVIAGAESLINGEGAGQAALKMAKSLPGVEPANQLYQGNFGAAAESAAAMVVPGASQIIEGGKEGADKAAKGDYVGAAQSAGKGAVAGAAVAGGTMAGAAYGAAVGSVILPVVGTAVGGAVGAYLGSKAAEAVVDAAKASPTMDGGGGRGRSGMPYRNTGTAYRTRMAEEDKKAEAPKTQPGQQVPPADPSAHRTSGTAARQPAPPTRQRQATVQRPSQVLTMG